MSSESERTWMLNKMIDKALEKRGFILVDENDRCAEYEYHNKQKGFRQTISIFRSSYGTPSVQSYQIVEEFFRDNVCVHAICSIPVYILPLLWLKAKVLAHKYGWENWKWVGPSDKTKKELKRIRRERKHNR